MPTLRLMKGHAWEQEKERQLPAMLFTLAHPAGTVLGCWRLLLEGMNAFTPHSTRGPEQKLHLGGVSNRGQLVAGQAYISPLCAVCLNTQQLLQPVASTGLATGSHTHREDKAADPRLHVCVCDTVVV